MRHAFGALLVAAAMGAAVAPAAAQDWGDEAEDQLYRPSTEVPTGESGAVAEGGAAEGAVTGPALSVAQAWGSRDSLAVLGGLMMPFGTPSRFGSADGPAFGGSVNWRRFLDGDADRSRQFFELALDLSHAAFSDSSADLADLEPSASSLPGTLDTTAEYLLLVGRLGSELWATADVRLTGWIGAGVGVERRTEDFRAGSGTTWEDRRHRSVAAGELGVGLEWRLGPATLECRLALRHYLGDSPAMGTAIGLGAGIGVRW